MKKIIPAPLRLQMKVWQRYISDLATGQLSNFTNNNILTEEKKAKFQEQITIAQALLPTSYSENKKHNLALAINRIQDIEIKPGKIFSFWHLVGQPDRSKGYLEGRSLIENQIKAEIGGGLCQLSGIIYWLILKAGLTPLERHSHSRDIYTENTRFAPLGSDATIVYGYKDLRFQNTLSFPISFRFNIEEQQIKGFLCSPQPMSEFEIEFKLQELPNSIKKVETIRYLKSKNTQELINTTIYKV